MRTIVITFSIFAACNNTSLSGSSATQRPDTKLPELDVTAPLRGSIQSGFDPIDVTGTVRDDRPGVRVMVNGVLGAIAPDGSFRVRIAPDDGMTLLHTVAIDAAGNQVNETRAVLNGNLVPVETSVKDSLLVRLDAAAIGRAGTAAAAHLGATDLASPLKLLNPLFESGLPCDGARVDLADLTHGAVRVGLVPQYNGLHVDAEIADLVATLVVNYSDSCTTMKAAGVVARAARAHLVGEVGIAIDDKGAIQLDTSAASLELEGFAFDAGLPDRVVLHVQQPLDDALTAFLGDRLTAAVPAALMRDLGEREPGDLALHATRLVFDPKGVSFALDTTASGGGAVYPHGFQVAPTFVGRGSGLGVGVAADALNQLVTVKWSSGALDQPVDASGAGFASVEVAFHLPPVMSVDQGGGGLHVRLGDIECRFVDAAGATAARAYLSADATLGVRVAADQVSLDPGTVSLYVDTVSDRDAQPAAMTTAQARQAADAVTRKLVDRIGGALSRLPLPASSGAMSVGPGLGGLFGSSPVEGYLLLSE